MNTPSEMSPIEMSPVEASSGSRPVHDPLTLTPWQDPDDQDWRTDLRSKLEQHERNARIGKMYFDDEMTTAEIAASTGYSQRQVQRHVRKAADNVTEMYAESMGVRVLKHDMRVLRGLSKYFDAIEEAGGIILAKDLPPLAGMLLYLSEKAGQLGAKGTVVSASVSGSDAQVNVAQGRVDDTLILMLGLDLTMADGVGSGRNPEEQVAAIEGAGEFIDALVVSDTAIGDDNDGYDDVGSTDLDASTSDDDPGRWEGGKWIPWWEDNPWHRVGDDEPEVDPTYFDGPVLSGAH